MSKKSRREYTAEDVRKIAKLIYFSKSDTEVCNAFEKVENLVHRAFSMCDTDLCGALELINEAFKDKNVPFLDYCVRESIICTHKACILTEKDVYTWFKANYKKHLGTEWKIVKRKNNPKHIPDFWVTDGTLDVPVECKFKCFDKNALRQLQRYMSFYGCSKGVAVAQSLTVKLPSSIQFVKVEL